MRGIIFLLLLFSAHPALASEDGYVHGKDHCFYFGAPKGWTADHISGRRQGLAFVFYPENSTWAKAKIVAYVRVASKTTGLYSPKDQVERTLKQFRTEYGSPNIRAKKIGIVKTNSGATGEIYRFEGDKRGNTELVVYFNGMKTINFFVMSSRDAKVLGKSLKVLKQLAQTYREANNCKPCSQRVTAPCGVVSPNSTSVNDLEERNKKSVATPKGQAYEMKAVKTFWGDLRFIQKCISLSATSIAQPLTIYFEVKADGRMGKLVINPRNKVAMCIARNVTKRRFPEPPSEFVVKIDLVFRE
jgi:hypothetical protein